MSSHAVLFTAGCPIGYAGELPAPVAAPQRPRHLPFPAIATTRAHRVTDVAGLSPRNVVTMSRRLPGLQINRRPVMLGDTRLARHGRIIGSMSSRESTDQQGNDQSQDQGSGCQLRSNTRVHGRKWHAGHRTRGGVERPGLVLESYLDEDRLPVFSGSYEAQARLEGAATLLSAATLLRRIRWMTPS